MRASKSARNPFITDITMIRVATPSAIPSSEKIAMTETKPSWRRARKYRNATIRSNALKITQLPAADRPSPLPLSVPLPRHADAGRGDPLLFLPRPACGERAGVRGSQTGQRRFDGDVLPLA